MLSEVMPHINLNKIHMEKVSTYLANHESVKIELRDKLQ